MRSTPRRRGVRDDGDASPAISARQLTHITGSRVECVSCARRRFGFAASSLSSPLPLPRVPPTVSVARPSDEFTISTRTVLLVITCLIGGTVLHLLVLGNTTASMRRDDGPGWMQALVDPRVGGGRRRRRRRRRGPPGGYGYGYADDGYGDAYDDGDAYGPPRRGGARRRARGADRWSGGLRVGARSAQQRLRGGGGGGGGASGGVGAAVQTKHASESAAMASALKTAAAAKKEAAEKAAAKAVKEKAAAEQRQVWLKRPSPYAHKFNWENSIIDFVHVPKAAGSVIKMVVIEWAQHKKMKVAGHTDDFLSMSRKEQDKHVAIWGHRGYGVHRQRGFKTNKHVKYFTFLREPIARAISQYEYHWSQPTRKGRKREPFMKWFYATRKFEKDNPWHVGNNPNVRQLCCWWGPFGDKHPAERCPPSEKTLQCAKKHATQMVMVGIQEQLEDGIALLLWRTGMKDYRIKDEKVVNVYHGKQKHKLTLAEEAQVRAALYLDIELYEFVKNKFRMELLEMQTGKKPDHVGV